MDTGEGHTCTYAFCKSNVSSWSPCDVKKSFIIHGDGNSWQMVGFSGEVDEGGCRGREDISQ